MKTCKTCVLPETFPGVSLDEGGQCIYCRRYRGRDNQRGLKERFKKKFLTVLEKVRNMGAYDAIVAYSGGKDSSYTLRLLKEEHGLKVLAITFDHGFVSPAATENIRNVTDQLDIDHMTFHPGEKTICELFVKSMAPGMYSLKALERASSICNSCMSLVKSALLKIAIEMKVPIIAYGWSPGQAPVQSSVFKTNGPLVKQMQRAMVKPFREMTGEKLSSFFLCEHHYGTDPSTGKDRFPYFIHPLSFQDYDEEKILDSIREIGWINPNDTDSNSTNCLLNGFANEVHIKQHDFHPYAFEISGLVRDGYMTREEGLKRLSIPPDPRVIEYVRQKLGIKEQA